MRPDIKFETPRRRETPRKCARITPTYSSRFRLSSLAKKIRDLTEPSEPNIQPQQHPTEPEVSRTEPGSLQLSCTDSQKNTPHEPEKMATFPEDERLMPENEPENILKIQVLRKQPPKPAIQSFRTPSPPKPSAIQRISRHALETFGHSHISPFKISREP
jgi:hypothetical protein